MEAVMDSGQLARQMQLAHRMWSGLQRERVRVENRLRSANLCQFCGGKKKPKKDHGDCAICDGACGHCEGSGQAPIQIPESALKPLGISIEHLRKAEDETSQHLVRLLRHHPLHSTFAEWAGLGEVLSAQLIGMIGTFERFRKPAKLWAYLGLGVGPDGKYQRRHRGEQTNFKPEGQVWAYKVGEQFWHWGKNGHFGQVYRERLVLEEEKGVEGPHAHRMAARYTVKMILKRLWCVAVGAEER